MKRNYFISILVLLILTSFSFHVSGQEIKQKKRGIIPDYISTQFAGNIGAGSIGVGYYLNKVRNLSSDFIYGYSPSYRTSVDLHNLVTRINYKPAVFDLSEKWSLRPLTSFAISMQINDNGRTFKRLPPTYPKDYYRPTAFRFHFDLGVASRYCFEQHTLIKAIEFYVTTTTNDLYVYYFFKSKEMTLFDSFSMAIGFTVFLFN